MFLRRSPKGLRTSRIWDNFLADSTYTTENQIKFKHSWNSLKPEEQIFNDEINLIDSCWQEPIDANDAYFNCILIKL